MIDQTAVALDHLVYRRWICTGPDHLDARHFRMSTERQIDPLKRIVNGCGDRVPQGLEVVQGVIPGLRTARPKWWKFRPNRLSRMSLFPLRCRQRSLLGVTALPSYARLGGLRAPIPYTDVTRTVSGVKSGEFWCGLSLDSFD
jgi:hypothetical protein